VIILSEPQVDALARLIRNTERIEHVVLNNLLPPTVEFVVKDVWGKVTVYHINREGEWTQITQGP
jgi:hypothetical protein